MSKGIGLLLLVLSLTACGEWECVDSRTVAKILAVKNKNVAVEMTDGSVQILTNRNITPGADVCIDYEQKEKK